MNVRKRTWKGADGKPRTAWQMDCVNPIDGERIRPVLKGCRNKAEAEEAARLEYAELHRRARLGPAAGPNPEEVRALTLAKLLEAHHLRPEAAERTRYDERGFAKNLCRHLGGDRPAATLTAADVERYKVARQGDAPAGRRFAPRTINIELQLLKAALNRAVRLGALPSVPCGPIRMLPEPKVRRRRLSPEELNRFLAACMKASLDLYDAVVLLFHLGGMRPSELWRLSWADVDLDEGRVRIGITKRGGGAARERHVPLNALARGVLLRRRQALPTPLPPNALVIGRPPEARDKDLRRNGAAGAEGHMRGEPFFGDYRFRAKLKAAAAAAGLERPEEVTAYTLRRSFGRHFRQAGGDLRDLQYTMGHSTPELTIGLYDDADEPATRRAMERLAPPTAAPPEPLNRTVPRCWGNRPRHTNGTRKTD